MKGKAEVDLQEPITDGLFIKPYVAVGTSVAVTYIVRLRWSRGRVLAFGTKVRGFTPGPSRRIFRAKNPQHAFLRRGSKAVGPMP
jgi:hypothetical protein